MKTTTAFPVSAFAVVLALVLPLEASAGNLRINFEDLFVFGGGEDWTGSGDNDIPLSVDGSSFTSSFTGFNLDTPPDAVVFPTTPFASGLRVGATTYNSFCLSKEGVVGLGIDAACSFTDPTSSPLFSVLGGPWDYVDSESAFSASSISVALGLVDRNLDDSVFERADAHAALRVMWLGMEETLRFQAVFFDMGGGNFDVEFNYDDLYSDGIQRITAPGLLDPLFFGIDAARLSNDTNTYFRFCSGVFSLSTAQAAECNGDPDPDPTPVPEPGTLWLLLSGSAAALLLRRRRNAS